MQDFDTPRLGYPFITIPMQVVSGREAAVDALGTNRFEPGDLLAIESRFDDQFFRCASWKYPLVAKALTGRAPNSSLYRISAASQTKRRWDYLRWLRLRAFSALLMSKS